MNQISTFALDLSNYFQELCTWGNNNLIPSKLRVFECDEIFFSKLKCEKLAPGTEMLTYF